MVEDLGDKRAGSRGDWAAAGKRGSRAAKKAGYPKSLERIQAQ